MAKKRCGTCEHFSPRRPQTSNIKGHGNCFVDLPMWADDGDAQAVNEDEDATHCAAYRERGKEARS